MCIWSLDSAFPVSPGLAPTTICTYWILRYLMLAAQLRVYTSVCQSAWKAACVISKSRIFEFVGGLMQGACTHTAVFKLDLAPHWSVSTRWRWTRLTTDWFRECPRWLSKLTLPRDVERTDTPRCCRTIETDIAWKWRRLKTPTGIVALLNRLTTYLWPGYLSPVRNQLVEEYGTPETTSASVNWKQMTFRWHTTIYDNA